MNRQLILYDIYSILMLQEEEAITIDKLCKELKCSKKSIYELFSSENVMFYEVFSLYKTQLLCLLKDITQLDCSQNQKLVFQIKELNRNAKRFFKSHLFGQLKHFEEFKELLAQTEKEIFTTSFISIINEIKATDAQKQELINILAFIGISIKKRYTLSNYQKKLNDVAFMEMMLTLLLSYTKNENIGLYQKKRVKESSVIEL